MISWFVILIAIISALGIGIYIKTKRHDAAFAFLGIALVMSILYGVGVISVADGSGGGGGGGGTNPTPAPALCDPKVIASLGWKEQEYGSNSWSAADSTVNYFGQGVDPSSANASAIDTTTITDGNGTETTGVLQTCTTYRTVLDGSTTYYDIDLGEIQFANPSTTDTSVTIFESIGEGSKRHTQGAQLVGTISDMVTETESGSLQGTDSNTLGNDVNELRSSGATLTYDKSDGDGQFKIRAKIECSGANKVCKNMAFGFEWDSSAPPEGTELSAITAQWQSGTAFAAMPSSLLNNWTKQIPIVIGTIEGGTSGTYDITFNVTEANVTAADDQFYMYTDDLGKWNGQDVLTGTKATGSRTQIKWQE